MNESWDWEATRGVEARSAVDKQIDRPTDRPTDQPTEPTGLKKKKEGNEEGWLHECMHTCRAGIVLPDSLSSALQSGRALDSGLCLLYCTFLPGRCGPLGKSGDGCWWE
jgi:hypothetical protein